jgi:phospholipase A-2-activating protein
VGGSQASKLLPMKHLVLFDAVNIDGPKKKLLEFTTELDYLTEAELRALDEILDLLKNKAFYHSSKFSKFGFLLIKKLINLPTEKVFPALDIYRMFLIHPQSSEIFKLFESGLE